MDDGHAPLAAEVVFNGIVRTPNKGSDVLYLEFEAYEALFHNEMKRIAETLESQFQIKPSITRSNGLYIKYGICI